MIMSGLQGEPYSARFCRELGSKRATWLKKSWGGGYSRISPHCPTYKYMRKYVKRNDTLAIPGTTGVPEFQKMFFGGNT